MAGKKLEPQKPSLIERAKYWCNHYLIHDTKSMFRTLAVVTIFVVVILALIIYLGGEADFFPAFWDSFATTINAWMPYSEDGGPLYLIVMGIGALIGILVASLLIGILSTAVEDKLEEIRTGNSKVIESGHIVVMGLHTGLYRLLRELFLTADGQNMTIVIAGEEDKPTVVEKIRDNVEIPKNIKVRYRKVDVCDPVDLDCLSLPTASKILMNHGDDNIAIKCILAISSITRQYRKRPTIVAIIHDSSNIPAFKQAGKGHTLLTLQSRALIARLIAHTCFQPGLSYVFEEIFGFDGYDFYFDHVADCDGMTFEEINQKMQEGIPVGIADAKKIHLNPDAQTVYTQKDQLIYLADNKDSYRIVDEPFVKPERMHKQTQFDRDEISVLIIGENEKIDGICEELSLIQCRITRCSSILSLSTKEIKDTCKGVGHIIVLSGREEGKLSDDEVIRTILILKGLREDHNLSFNITAEMLDEKNKVLISDHHMDFVIASDFSNMVMAQLVESPKRLPIFRELLSVEGNEIYALSLSAYLQKPVALSCKDLRQFGMDHGYVVLGYRKNDSKHALLVNIEESVTLAPQDDLIVLAHRFEL